MSETLMLLFTGEDSIMRILGKCLILGGLAMALLHAANAAAAEEWKPVEGHVMTRWAEEVSPENVHPEYPRPMMERKDWLNLNGLWDYAIQPKDDKEPAEFDGKILVPFPVESALSGVKKRVGKDNRLWYRRTVQVPSKWSEKRILLHFGAVDWETTVWVNGEMMGTHKGGYDAFSFDITKALKKSGEAEIVLSVWDPTNDGYQPRGKQVNNNRGIWYTPVTGIWQTAWIEPVPETYIKSIHLEPDVDGNCLWVTAEVEGDMEECDLGAMIPAFSKRFVIGTAGKRFRISLPDGDAVKLWSPDSPQLYTVNIALIRNGRGGRLVTPHTAQLDRVESYFGMRKVSLGKDENGITRIMLNGEFLFQYGPLDQGWWPDGLYTAPTDEALRSDIETLKKVGCNMLRKHVKIEPQRLYYWCDKLGLLVWQDMPNGDKHIGGSKPDIERTPESAANFRRELKAMIDGFRNHPSIIFWVPYNEGWGQYDTAGIVKWIKDYDPSRLVINASGWTDRGVGDAIDVHRYPGPGMAPAEANRASVLGEFGGLGLPLPGHTWQTEKNWGYRSYETREELTEAYVTLLRRLHPLVGKGLSAAVYTQTSDVEVEVNGLLTYDRAILKMDPERIREAAERLHLPPPEIETVLPSAADNQGPQKWRYTTEKPPGTWKQLDFDDSSWKTGTGGFGTKGTPGALVGTKWDGKEIWLRRVFDLETVPSDPRISIHHDEDAEVFVNAVEAAKLRGYSTSYVPVPMSGKAREALKKGRNVLAVHCKQTTGGQYIDVGLDNVVHKTP